MQDKVRLFRVENCADGVVDWPRLVFCYFGDGDVEFKWLCSEFESFDDFPRLYYGFVIRIVGIVVD